MCRYWRTSWTAWGPTKAAPCRKSSTTWPRRVHGFPQRFQRTTGLRHRNPTTRQRRRQGHHGRRRLLRRTRVQRRHYRPGGRERGSTRASFIPARPATTPTMPTPLLTAELPRPLAASPASFRTSPGLALPCRRSRFPSAIRRSFPSLGTRLISRAAARAISSSPTALRSSHGRQRRRPFDSPSVHYHPQRSQCHCSI